ncbi:hypothetical protein WIS52_14965 [Pseudonocardia nematodicida]|uniref:Uncharacterized protein n=1 Tax=Pseudonocardia nematodicida TaxID=1206997 RepID=A0ABV1KD14_9PSEU
MAALLVAVVIGAIVGLVAWGGWWLAIALLRRERERLMVERAELDLGWQTLDRTARIRQTFLAAHQALRHEAQRQYRGGDQ